MLTRIAWPIRLELRRFLTNRSSTNIEGYKYMFPDPREDLESRSPNLGPILLRVPYRNPH